MKNLLITGCFCVALIGCASNTAKPRLGETAAAENVLDKVENMLSQLNALERSGAWEDAFIGYRSVLANPADETTTEDARLGGARCLIAMEQHHAALAMLSPLPDKTVRNRDRRRLALAAEAMMRLGDWAHAESLAEVALSGLDPDVGLEPWVAVCCANLAKAYLENDKPNKSAAMFRSASRRFQLDGREQAATECLALALEIEKILEGATSKRHDTDGHTRSRQ
jgi:tetratricopeptide (TPR) repeat protein